MRASTLNFVDSYVNIVKVQLGDIEAYGEG
jgi:hypothetical protein